MPPFVGVVGRSNSGKTRLIEQLLPHFTRRGLRVGTVKHATHRPALDVPGKDSWRHGAAGAARVLLLGPEAAILFVHQGAVDELAAWRSHFAGTVDLVIVEGFRDTPQPQVHIEVGPQFALTVAEAPQGPQWTLTRPAEVPDPFGFPEPLVAGLADEIAARLLPAGATAP